MADNTQPQVLDNAEPLRQSQDSRGPGDNGTGERYPAMFAGDDSQPKVQDPDQRRPKFYGADPVATQKPEKTEQEQKLKDVSV